MTAAALALSATYASGADQCSIPDGWPLASAIQDLGAIPASSVPTAFGLNGWSRISEKLANTSSQRLSEARGDPLGFAQSLLAGSDTEQYCARIGTLSQNARIDIPLTLMEARDVAAALHPFLPDLAEKLAAKPGGEVIPAAIQALIAQIARDDRLAAQIDLVRDQISSGVLKLPRPADWACAWPPDRSRLEAMAQTLRHQPADKLRICSQSTAAPVPAKQISEARQIAEILTKAVEKWADSCASLNPLLEKTLPQTDPAIADYIVKATSQEPQKPVLFLGPIASDSTTYFAAIRARINNRDFRWPLGITIGSVSIGANGRPSFQPVAMRPNIAPVDADALLQTLRQLGLPAIVSISNPSLQVDESFQAMRIKARFAVGKHAFDREVVLIEKGTARDPELLISDLKKDITGSIAEIVRKMPLPVSLNGKAIKLAQTNVEINDDLTAATVSGNLEVSVPFGALPGPIPVSATFSVPMDGGAVRLKNARWPDQILEGLRAQLSSHLAATVPGGVSCVGIAGLDLELDDKVELRLRASFAQDGRILGPQLIDTTRPFEALTARLVQLAAEPSVLQCIARQALGISEADVKAAIESLMKTNIKLLGLEFNVRDPQPVAANGKLGFKFDLALAADDALLIKGVRIENGWTPGNPISATSLSIEGVAVPSATAKRLLAQINPKLTDWITLDRVAFGGGQFALDGQLTVPGMASPIPLRNLVLKLDAAAAEISAILQFCSTRRTMVDESAWFLRYLARALPALGFVGTILGILFALRGADGIVSATSQAERVAAMAAVTAPLAFAFSHTFIALVFGLITGFIVDRQTALERIALFSFEETLIEKIDSAER